MSTTSISASVSSMSRTTTGSSLPHTTTQSPLPRAITIFGSSLPQTPPFQTTSYSLSRPSSSYEYQPPRTTTDTTHLTTRSSTQTRTPTTTHTRTRTRTSTSSSIRSSSATSNKPYPPSITGFSSGVISPTRPPTTSHDSTTSFDSTILSNSITTSSTTIDSTITATTSTLSFTSTIETTTISPTIIPTSSTTIDSTITATTSTLSFTSTIETTTISPTIIPTTTITTSRLTTMSYIPSTTSTSAAPTVIPILTPSKGPNKLSAGAITGIVIGGVTGFLILTLLGFLVWRRQHAQDTRYYPDSPPMQETHHTAYGDGGGGGGDQIMARNSGAGLEVTSNNSNIPYGGGFMPSHDQIISTPTDTEHSLPSQSTGYEHNNASSLVIPVSGLYDYGNEYDFQHQTRLQPRPQRPYLPPNQPLSYTPPTEPGFAPENRYDPNYAARQAQEAAYMNYQQRQLYLQSQRRLLQQRQKQQQYLAGQSSIPAPMIPSEEVNNSRSDAVGSNNAEEFNPQNRFSVASTNSQEYLDRLRGDYPPATINQNLMSGHSPTADGATSVVENIGIPNPIIPPSSNFSGPQYQGLTSSQLSINPTLISNDATGTSEGMAQFNNYAYPESDARRTVPTSVVTVEPPNQPITNNPETMAVTTGDIQESRLTPPMELRHIEDRTEGEYNSGFPKRSSVASQTPSAVSSPNSKRSPQVLYPEEDN